MALLPALLRKSPVAERIASPTALTVAPEAMVRLPVTSRPIPPLLVTPVTELTVPTVTPEESVSESAPVAAAEL